MDARKRKIVGKGIPFYNGGLSYPDRMLPQDDQKEYWVKTLSLSWLESLWGKKFHPNMLQLEESDQAAFSPIHTSVGLSPHRHYAYGVEFILLMCVSMWGWVSLKNRRRDENR